MNNLLRSVLAVVSTALPLVLAGPAHAVEGSAPSQAGPCGSVVAPPGRVCVPAPRQCITAPCPQYDLVALPTAPWPDVRD